MDNSLLEMAKNGDKGVFSKIITEKYIKYLYTTALKKVSNEDDAMEVVQDTLVEILSNIEQLNSVEKFGAWVNTIMRNRVYYTYKERDREVYSIELENDDIENKEFLSELEDLDVNIDLSNLISDFNYIERQIILMYLRRYTAKEIAEELGLNENTVRTQIMRLKAKIRGRYKRGVE